MNLIGCWFDATPCCHGAGGIARQYKFGGRSGGCVALLGVAELVLGLGSSLVKILDQFPVGVLGVLLLFAGIELDMCSRDMNSKEESVVMLICTLFHLLAQVQHLNFFVGLLVHLLLMTRILGDGQSCSTIECNNL
ncbi:Molybdate transporter 1 [Forsythia ovata]|uniref:Molybdate transporter 1 n=1 Tax=Forsythia ovata TaxID=205694 RepID=A0ABD1SJ90_9LAMI